MSAKFHYTTYLKKNKLDKLTFKKLYNNYDGCDFGTILCGEERLRLKTELVRMDYSVTEILVTTVPEETIENLFIVTGFYKNIKEDLIKLAEKYNQNYITYFNRESNTYYLIDIKTKTETKLELPMFDDEGYLNYEVPGNHFKFKDFVYGHTKVDCTKGSYNISTAMCLVYFGDDYVLRD